MPENIESYRYFSIREIVLISMFTAVIAVCSWITVPTTIPFTLQTFGIFCSMLIPGGKNGFFSILVYILLGIIGIPVFSGFKSGFNALTSYSGGYIWGFIFLGIVFWTMEKIFGNKFFIQIVSLILGMVICYICGTLWFTYVMKTSFIYGLTVCVMPYIIFDAIKLICAIWISDKIKKLQIVDSGKFK